ncbi:MAG: TolC family protein [Rhizobiales bacterium]|nr:TolC family protein [Hyphomicrobiales bacterium]
MSTNRSANVRKTSKTMNRDRGYTMGLLIPVALMKAGVAGASAIILSACTTTNIDGAVTDVNALVAERTKKTVSFRQDPAARQEADYAVRQLMKQRLSSDTATQIAFLRNPAIQASLAKIGIAEADVAQAGRMRNPVVSIGRVTGGGVLEIERQFLFSLLSLFTIGPRTAIAKDQAERARYMTALDIVGSADGVRRAWIEAVTARERVRIMKQIYESAKAAENLGMRMAAAGSMPALDQAKLKVAKADAAGQLGKFRVAAGMAREKLIREMGVWGKETKFKLPSRLPRLPGRANKLSNIERKALMKRLDIQAGRKELEFLQKNIGLTKFTGVVNLLEISGFANTEKEREDGGEINRKTPSGFEVEFAIPIFDPGDAKVARAEYVYMQAVEELKSAAINARSEVREAYTGYRGAFDLARHYQRTIVPLNKRITDEELLRYNGMLASVLDLLSASRQQQAALMKALDARRDFWLAEAQLNFVMVAGSGKGLSMGVQMADAGGGDEEH